MFEVLFAFFFDFLLHRYDCVYELFYVRVTFRDLAENCEAQNGCIEVAHDDEGGHSYPRDDNSLGSIIE